MKKTTYSVDQDGVIHVTDRRQFTNGVITPNYVYDLYGPILTFEGLGFLGLIYRLNGSPIAFRDLMKYGKVGYEKLKKLLDLLQELKIIEYKIPRGIDRLKHFRMEIDLLDPPHQVPEQYQQLVIDNTIAKWLFEKEEVEQATYLPEESPPPRVRVSKNPKEYELSTRIKNAYYNELSKERQATFNTPFQMKGAKLLADFARKMEWSDEEAIRNVITCWHDSEKDRFWNGQVTLQLLHSKFIGPWSEKRSQEDEIQIESNDKSHLNLHPKWKEITRDQKHPLFWEVGTRLPYGDTAMEVKEMKGKLYYIQDGTNKVLITKGS